MSSYQKIIDRSFIFKRHTANWYEGGGIFKRQEELLPGRTIYPWREVAGRAGAGWLAAGWHGGGL
jgi:hypothetical protein